MGLAGWGLLFVLTLHVSVWAVCGLEMFEPVDTPENDTFGFFGGASNLLTGIVNFVILADLDDCFSDGIATFLRLFVGLIWFLVIIGALLGVALD